MLVYATCSLLREEGEVLAQKLLEWANGQDEGSPSGGLVVLPFESGEIPGLDRARTDEGFLRVLPGVNVDWPGACDGFFVARFRKL